MSVKFKVKMTEDYMFDFMVHHNYTNFSGLLGLGVGLLGLFYAAYMIYYGSMQTAYIGIVVAIVFLGITPYSLKSKAKMQVKNSKMFQKELEYELSEKGVTVRQGKVEATNAWEDFSKVVSTKKSLILYVARVRALILPKECIGEQYKDAVNMICDYMPSKKVKIKRIY